MYLGISFKNHKTLPRAYTVQIIFNIIFLKFYLILCRFARLGKRGAESLSTPNSPTTNPKATLNRRKKREVISLMDTVDTICRDLHKKDSIVGISQWGKKKR